uniref:Uncharacterized protein n=1 Tax=Sphaeramia orbicularis TaxID=375764 RepID=A0A672ZT02_9TELE
MSFPKLLATTHSLGKAGRSREPGALSYSNMCFQTDGRGRKKKVISKHLTIRCKVVLPDQNLVSGGKRLK